MLSRYTVRLAAVLTLLGCVTGAHAAPVIQVTTDLRPLIFEAVKNPQAFAVPIPSAVSAGTDGVWVEQGGVATWTYAVQVPGAVSMSFHADKISLPENATLYVSSGSQTRAYSSSEVAHGELWSRVAAGDTLSLSVSLPASEKTSLVLSINELQAGYRGLGDTSSHPYYRALVANGTAATTPSCIENYECDRSTANDGPARATAAYTNHNTIQCTGTVINDTAGDFKQYFLTARHCQASDESSEDNDASSMVFYWGATTPCGQTLATIYDAATATTSGATNRAEQADGWLVEMSQSPPYGVFYAGWDATGGTFSGGYGIHHGNANAKQYVEWFGQPFLNKGTSGLPKHGGKNYVTDAWYVVPQKGTVVSGASGSALFDPSNRVVGTATIGTGVCPAAAPQPASAGNAVGIYDALEAYYNVTTDPSSTTGTFASFLDAKKTGSLVVAGVEGPLPPPPSVTVSLSPTSIVAGSSSTLTWSSTGATACVASGSWSGTEATHGTASESPSSAGSYTYTLTCSNAGGSTAKSASLTVTAQSSSSGGGGSSSSSSSGGGTGGGGGGGAIGIAPIAMLGMMALVRRRKPRR